MNSSNNRRRKEEEVKPTWCKSLKKIELHAHLSGSIGASTIQGLLNKPENARIHRKAAHLFDVETGRTLKHCFDLFPIIHELLGHPSTLQSIVHEVLHDFADDNVIYLELRTTPRQTNHMTEFTYLQSVLQGVADFHQSFGRRLVCRILVSISRHLPVEAAWRTVQVTEGILTNGPSRFTSLIVGFELSGAPQKGCWADFQPVFQYVRDTLNLPISLHFAEVENEEECLDMLKFRPDRVGHAAVMSDLVSGQLLKQRPKIGVEVCITSNLKTTHISKVLDHPVVTHLIPENHPFCICTDDSGVFDTSVSEEIALLVNATGMSKENFKRYINESVNLAFCREEDVMNDVKNKLLDE